MIKIKEVLPNPVGADKDGEYIILVNDSQESVSLGGWKIRDKSGKEFSLSGYVIEAGEGLEFSGAVTKLKLNNSDEVIELLSPAGQVEDSVSYTGSVGEGQLVLHSQQLTGEVYEQLFDELAVAGEGRIMNSGGVFSFQFLLTLGLVGVLVGVVGVGLKKMVEREGQGG